MTTPRWSPVSSRVDSDAAGWKEQGEPTGPYVNALSQRVVPGRFSWLRPRVLLESRNSILAGLIGHAKTDIVNDERRRWMARQAAAGAFQAFPRLTIDRYKKEDDDDEVSFLVIGDPGEGDVTQYAVVPHLLAQDETQFMVVLSDVIYPTGESNDYIDCFYRPYLEYTKPIYAIPGNHDWYSLLSAFMWHFCGAEPLPQPTYRLSSYSWQERLARFLWLRPRAPYRTLLEAFRAHRWAAANLSPATQTRAATLLEAGMAADAVRTITAERPGAAPLTPPQPAPYFAIDLKDFLLLFIDTGTSGELDREQGLWLCEVSEDSRPKILFTGKPIWVDHKQKRCRINWEPPEYVPHDEPGDTAPRAPTEKERQTVRLLNTAVPDVATLVECPSRKFIAAIGGDTHNYQRYPVRNDCVDDAPARTTQYVVSGGAGAFLTPTHVIPRADPAKGANVTESEYRCYPLRGDSLARFSLNSGRRIWRAAFFFALAALLLLYGAVNVANRDWFPPFTWDMDLDSTALAWLPGDSSTNYDRYVTFGLAVLVALVGVALLLLPWFRLRVRIVIALMAGVAASYLAGFMDTPTFTGAALVAVLAPLVLTLGFVRRVPTLVRGLAILGLAAGAAYAAVSAGDDRVGHEAFLIAFLGFAAVAILFVGGPDLSPMWRVFAAVTVSLTAAILFAIVIGYGWFPLAALGVLLLMPPVLALIFLRGLLFPYELKSDDAARFIADEFKKKEPSVEPVRKSAREARLSRRAKSRANALMPTSLRRFLYGLSETPYSALFDYNDQPVFKHFLRIDVAGDELTVSCFGVSSEEQPATLEDQFSWNPRRGWTTSCAALAAESTPRQACGDVRFYGADGGGPRLVFDRLDAPTGTYDVSVRANAEDDWRDVGSIVWDGERTEQPVDGPIPPRGWFAEIRLSPSAPGGTVLRGRFL